MSTVFFDEVYAENILLKLWKQCENEELCDVVLIAGTEEKRIPAHRTILSIASEYFQTMFTSSMCESTSKNVKMTSLNAKILQSLIEYCYTGRVEINEDIVVELLNTADLLLLRNVVTACANLLEEQLHPSNCLGFAILAERYCCDTLLHKARSFILEYFVDVCNTDEFLSLSLRQLCELLASDELCVTAEEDVFNSVRSWIEHDRSKREKYTDELLRLVRMPLLERAFLIQHVKPICTSTECLQMYADALQFNLLPNSAKKLLKPRSSYQYLMAIGGGDKESDICVLYYCPQRLQWMKWLLYMDYRYQFNVAIMGENLFIVGGCDADENILNTVICLNLRTMNLSYISPMIEHRASCRVAVMNEYLYAVGGRIGRTEFKSSVEKWNSKTNQWSKVASMAVSRCHFGIAVLNAKIYVVGGFSNGSALYSVECYDPIQNIWKSVAPMNESRVLPGAAVTDGLLYAVGGMGSRSVERYDPTTNKWTLVCSLSESLYGFKSCTTFHNRVLICYGDHVEEYNPAADEWKMVESIDRLTDMRCMFSYSGKLYTSEFEANYRFP